MRRILVLTAESRTAAEARPEAFRETVVELGILTLMSVSLVFCLCLLRTRDVAATAGAERR